MSNDKTHTNNVDDRLRGERADTTNDPPACDSGTPRAMYTAEEVELLADHTPRMRQLVHDVKTVFATWGPVDIVEHGVVRGEFLQ